MSTVVAQNFKDPTTLKTVDAAYITSSVKVWIDFNGTGTPSIRASLNVSSLTDLGVGQYTVNYTSALSSVISPAAGISGNGSSGSVFMTNGAATPTASSVSPRTMTDTGGLTDQTNTSVLVAGDLA